MVFVFDVKFGQKDHYFTIKINKILNENKDENDDEMMITIIDATTEILRNNEKQ